MDYKPEFSDESIRKPLTIASIEGAIQNTEILEAIVESCDSELTLKLNMGEDITGYIKFDELEYKIDSSRVKDIAAMSKVGRHVKFVPESIMPNENGTGYIVKCSRKKAQELCYRNYLSKLRPGDIIDARVITAEKFGVFCDVGCGIISLLPTNLISVTHIIDATQLFKHNAKIKVVVKNSQADGKIQLSHRELLGTWEEEVGKINAGDIICGTVLSVEEYGVFIRISQNLSGLASNALVIDKLELNPGDVVSVKVKSIITEDTRTKRVKLNILEKIDGRVENLKFKYYKVDGHLDKWVYNTNCKKCIETDFSVEPYKLADLF